MVCCMTNNLAPRILRFFGQGLVARRDWGTGLLVLKDFCGKTMQAVTRQPILFEFPRVSPGNQPLAKEPEDSGHEIDLQKHLPCFIK